MKFRVSYRAKPQYVEVVVEADNEQEAEENARPEAEEIALESVVLHLDEVKPE